MTVKGGGACLIGKLRSGQLPEDRVPSIAAYAPPDAQLQIEHEVIGAVTLEYGLARPLFPLQPEQVICSDAAGGAIRMLLLAIGR